MTDPKPQPPEERTFCYDCGAPTREPHAMGCKYGRGENREAGEPVPAPERETLPCGVLLDDPLPKNDEEEKYRVWLKGFSERCYAKGFNAGLQQGKREGLEQAAREIEANGPYNTLNLAVAAIRNLK